MCKVICYFMRITKFFGLIGVLGFEFEGVEASCPRPSFPGDQTANMSPTEMMKRAARRSGGVPSDAEISSSPNVIRLKRVFPESLFNFMFPNANAGRGPLPGSGPYTYANFLKAAAMWPDFCNSSATAGADLDTLCKRELASMFAHFAQEVGEHDPHSSIPEWRQGLYYYTELGCSEDPKASGCEYRGGTCDVSTWMGQIWQCPAGTKYFGRGAKQLSYNFNYGPFSYAMFGDVDVLLKEPSLVVANDSVNGWLGLASALWFYMTPQSPKPSMHDVVAGYWQPSSGDISGNRLPGFGVLIMIINGGIECGGSTEIAQAANRITYYKAFLSALGLPAESDASMTCTRMQQFDASSSAFTPSYWEQSWSTQACGVSCQLVSYQTGFSIFDDPLSPDTPYSKCIQFYFGTSTTDGPSTSSTASTTTTPSTVGPNNPCMECNTCVAVPGNYQAAKDSDCSPCGSGTLQTWWPCNVSGLCQCASSPSTSTSTISASSTATTVTTSTVTTQTTTVTTSTTTTSSSSTATSSVGPNNPCAKCPTCSAVPGNYQAATDSDCAPCGSGTLQTWWPCNVSGLCQCSAVSTVAPPTSTTFRTTTTTMTTTISSAPVNPCLKCDVCKAVAGNIQGATSAHCAPCAKGGQSWWPCNIRDLCTCQV
jgi:hypothetical protein